MHDCEIRLKGYLSCGKFQVNDYTIAVEVVDAGTKLTITDGEGTVQQALITNGQDGNLDEINATLAEMLDQQTAYAAAEELRAAAETARAAAETARAAAEAERADEFQDFLDQVDDDLEAAEAAKVAAQEAAQEAAQAAEQAAAAATGGLYDMLFYKNGDVISFVEEEQSTGTEVNYTVSTESQTPCLNSSGYVTDTKKKIVISIPVAKSLHYVTSVTIGEHIFCHIANSGGYGLKTSATTSGDDYINCLSEVIVNKVKNTIDLVFRRSTAFNLNNNEPVAMRVKGDGLQITMHTGGGDD